MHYVPLPTKIALGSANFWGRPLQMKIGSKFWLLLLYSMLLKKGIGLKNVDLWNTLPVGNKIYFMHGPKIEHHWSLFLMHFLLCVTSYIMIFSSSWSLSSFLLSDGKSLLYLGRSVSWSVCLSSEQDLDWWNSLF